MSGAGPPHVIRRQTLELTLPCPLPSGALPAEAGALELQEQAGRLFRRRVAPAIDRVLSELGGGEVIHLDRVELDLGTLSAARLADELADHTAARLKEILGAELASLRRSAGGASGHGRWLRPEAGDLRWLRVFLATGRLPWWVPAAVAADPEARLAELVEEAPRELAAALREARGRRPARRLARQFQPALRRRLLALLAADRPALEPALAEWRRLLAEELPELPGAGAASGVRQRMVDRVLFQLLAAGPSATAGDLSRRLVAAIATAGRLPPGDVHRRLATAARRALPPGSEVRAWLEENHPRKGLQPAAGDSSAPAVEKSRAQLMAQAVAAESALAGARKATGPAPPAASDPGRSGDALPPPLRPEAGRVPPATTEPERARRAPLAELLDPEEALAVDDAGLVLLAPFLPSYFANLALVEEGDFPSETARERAVLLLRYLATGTAEAFEHLLVLDKLLCGWPLEEPVCREIEPTAAEARESEDLLASVVGHWQALKKTSAAGLRASFLAREGRLEEVDQGWQLTVRRTGYDVLLDRLPWSLGLVRLPWMEKPLFVEW